MSPAPERIRVLICINYFHPYVSGVSEFARSLAQALGADHDVTVLTGRHKLGLAEEELFEGYRIRRSPILFRLDKGYVSYAFIRDFLRETRRADVVILQLPMLEAALFALCCRRPLLATYHCDLAASGGLLRRLAIRVTQTSMAVALSRCWRIAPTTLDYARSSRLLRRHLQKMTPIAPPNRFGMLLENPVATRSEASAHGRPVSIGFVGRFVEEKGIEFLLQAAARFRGENVKFILAGDYSDVAGGSIYPRLQPFITALGDQVELLGAISDDRLIEFYNSIDIIALPSTNRFEAFGMVQIEAMTFGVIPVASDLPGVRTVAQTTGCGAIVTPDDVDSLEAGLRSAMAQRATRSRRDIQARVAACYPPDLFGAAYAALVAEAAQSRMEY